jgi:drug/metabolite transporter (DMT)-like permease
MKKQILLLRLSYWAAAIADFSIAILVLIPERMGLTEIVYPMGLISAVALSWGILLLIADRKPLERRWILIPTIIVVALLSMARIIFALNETIEFSFAFFLFGVILIILMAYSYYYANKFDTNN